MIKQYIAIFYVAICLGILMYFMWPTQKNQLEFIEEEIKWLIIMGSSIHGQKFVEEFGGYWPEYNLYTEEYIPGETVLQHLERNQAEIASEVYPDRWQMRWLHFIWNGISAYLEFWKNSGKTQMIADASPRNVIIPEYDYYTGTRLISISGREKANSIYDVLITLYQKFILEDIQIRKELDSNSLELDS